MKKLLLLLLSFTFIFNSCKQDDDNTPFNPGMIDNQDDVAFQENFGSTMTSNITGRVVDADGNQINDAQITIGNSVSTTDHNGIFVLNNVSVFENFAYIKASKTGYLNGSRAIVPADNGTNQIIITLLRKNIVGTVDSGVASEVIMDDSKVQFTGGFIDSNGNAYDGQVEVSMHYLKPNAEATFTQMPGMLFAQAQNNDAVGLETYGMLAVNLFTPGGNALNIAEDSPATLEFPVDTAQTAIAPETMNLWSFDETVGYWKEDGSATKVGNTYVAEVSHFSWWNCDLPLDYINVCVSLETENGALANNYFEIIRNETGQTIFSGNTNADGEICGLFPANEQVTIKVYGEEACQDDVIHEDVVGPFATDTNITVTVPTSNIQQTNIIATVNTCDGQPLTNGYVFIFDNNSEFSGSSTVIPITNGNMDTIFSYCEGDSTLYSLIIYDLDAGQNSGAMSFNFEADTTNLGVLSTCEQTGGAYQGDLILETQEDVNNFGLLGYTEIEGSLLIGDDNLMSNEYTNINNLSVLNGLTSVSSTLTIAGNLISSLSGLEGISTVGSLKIERNAVIENLEALSNLSGSILDCTMSNNWNLNSLRGLDNLTSINGRLSISSHNNITSLNGLEGLNTINSLHLVTINNLNGLDELNGCIITGGIILSNLFSLETLNGINTDGQLDSNDGEFNGFIGLNDCPLITNLNEFNNVTSCNQLAIINMDGLTSLNELSGLQTIAGNVEIHSNDNLMSLNGLDNLSSVGGMFHIGKGIIIQDPDVEPNPQLTDFCALENLVNNGTFGEFVIENNAYNPTVQDIIDGNCAQ